jgi:hypothetical protein
VALRRENISVIAPAPGADGEPPPPPTVNQDPADRLLLGDRIFRGTVEVLTGLRLSDFLRLTGPFLTVRRG